MNPVLWLVVLLAGTSMLILGVLSAVLGWLPLVQAVALAIVGAAIEIPAALAFALSRRKPSAPRQLSR